MRLDEDITRILVREPIVSCDDISVKLLSPFGTAHIATNQRGFRVVVYDLELEDPVYIDRDGTEWYAGYK